MSAKFVIRQRGELSIQARIALRIEESGKAAARLTNGMRVIVMLDDGTERETYTRSDPWQMGHGEWVVKLDGIAGGYSTMRVRPA